MPWSRRSHFRGKILNTNGVLTRQARSKSYVNELWPKVYSLAGGVAGIICCSFIASPMFPFIFILPEKKACQEKKNIRAGVSKSWWCFDWTHISIARFCWYIPLRCMERETRHLTQVHTLQYIRLSENHYIVLCVFSPFTLPATGIFLKHENILFSTKLEKEASRWINMGLLQ